jgi:DNA-binding winged helix-turn-helix (wHTH) protein/tetratricopeptide (TPR) repeat protein
MHAAGPGARYRFGRFTLLAGEQRLLHDDQAVALGPRAFDVLVALVERAGQLVSKEELLATVWRGLVVEEANLHVQVSQLRKVVGADAIATVPAQGYRFTAPVTTDAVTSRRLSIIVLPFVESGAPPGSEHFADALTDEITTQLSRMAGSHVVPSRTALAYKHEPFELRAVARELGVRYALQGRVEQLASAVDANVRLADAVTGAVIWADSFVVRHDGEPRAARREIVARTLNALTLELVKAEARHAEAGPSAPEAADLLMRAGALAMTARSPADYLAAIGLIDRARELAPDEISLLAYRARTLSALVAVWPGPDAEAQIAQAERDIMAALAGGASSPHAHCTLSRVRQLQLRIGAALTAVDQALELNPDFAEAIAWRGALLVYDGRIDEAQAPLHRVLDLLPRDPQRWAALFWLGKSQLLCGRYADAVPWLEKSAAIQPFWGTHAFLVAANAQLGRQAETQAALAQLRAQVGDLQARSRGLRLSTNPSYRRLRREHYAGGLLKAGAITDVSAFD